MNVNTVMDALGARLGTITGLRVYDYPPDTVAPPAAIVGLPTTVDFDYTKGRGMDRVVFPVTILVGRVSDRASRDKVAVYLSGDSVKAAVDGALGGAVEVARVAAARTDIVTIGTIDYVGASFDVEVID